MARKYLGQALFYKDRGVNIGDSDTFTVELQREGEPISLAGANFELVITSLPASIELDDTVNPTQIVVDEPNGRITVNILSADTTGKTAGIYTYELRGKIAGLPEVRTLVGGDYRLSAATAPIPA